MSVAVWLVLTLEGGTPPRQTDGKGYFIRSPFTYHFFVAAEKKTIVAVTVSRASSEAPVGTNQYQSYLFGWSFNRLGNSELVVKKIFIFLRRSASSKFRSARKLFFSFSEAANKHF